MTLQPWSCVTLQRNGSAMAGETPLEGMYKWYAQRNRCTSHVLHDGIYVYFLSGTTMAHVMGKNEWVYNLLAAENKWIDLICSLCTHHHAATLLITWYAPSARRWLSTEMGPSERQCWSATTVATRTYSCSASSRPRQTLLWFYCAGTRVLSRVASRTWTGEVLRECLQSGTVYDLYRKDLAD